MASILVVDDDNIILQLLTDTLNNAGHEAMTASCPSECMEILQQEAFDAVVLDIVLPEKSGIEMIPDIKAVDEDLPIIVMTSSASVETVVDAVRAGAYDYITKPINPDNFFQCLDRALERVALFRDRNELISNLEKRVAELELFREASISISSMLDLNKLLERIMTIAKATIGAEACSVLLYDKNLDELKFSVALGEKADKVKEFRIKPGQGIAGWVLETGKAAIVDDVNSDDRFFKEPDRKTGFQTKNMIAVPLFCNEEIVGVIQVINKVGGATFDEQDLSVLTTMSTQIAIAIKNAQLVSELDELFYGTIRALASAVDAKSPWTSGHSERVTYYAIKIGEAMGLPDDELKMLEIASTLHDVGKIGTDEYILDKPGKLSSEEYAIIKEHPAKGADLLGHISHLEGVIPAVRYHHENYDGSGYPDSLKGEDIPILARILAAADTLDAMKADRPYRKGRSTDIIVDEFNKESGVQFDPRVSETLIDLIGKGLIDDMQSTAITDSGGSC